MPVLGRTKKHVVSEFRCSEILDAARSVFARKGFAAATVEDIAETAGLAKGTVYLYFRSKREVYFATLRQGLEAMRDEVGRSMDAEPEVAGKIRAFIRTRLEYSERNRDFIRIYYTEFNNMLIHPAHVRQEFQDIYDRQAAALTRVLDQGNESGEIRRLNTAASARIIYDMTRGLIAQRLLGWSNASVEEDAGFLFDLIWKGVGCQTL
jgi:AcrR family transcriptional regulator